MNVNDFIKALMLFVNEHPEAMGLPIGRHHDEYGFGETEKIEIVQAELFGPDGNTIFRGPAVEI
jgi:hypothetical protein